MSELSDTSAHLSPRERADRFSLSTRRVYDALAPIYTISAQLFHSHAHDLAVAASGIENGMRVLELAMGSGEMFQRLLSLNPDGQTIGIDLSPKMAARSQVSARREFPRAAAYCQAADARSLPFPSNSFDAIVCCFLFELLPREDLPSAMKEVNRVLRPEGNLALTLIAQNKPSFNAVYKVCSRVAPAFWGRQVDEHVMGLLPRCGFKVRSDVYKRQVFYRSRIVSATK